MKLYRIYTEWTPEYGETVDAIIGEHFDGFTTYLALGSWKGQREDAYVVEILTHGGPAGYEKVRAAASNIRAANGQESVLFTVYDVEAEFVAE